jgi:hypothetical protein
MEFSTNEVPIVPLPTNGDVLTEVIRQGAKQLWMAAASGGGFGNFDAIDKLYALKNLRKKKSAV